MYERKKYIFDDSIEVEEKHSARYGAPGMKRERKKKVTPELMAKQNQRGKEKKVRRLIKWNFKIYDYWMTLTYREGLRPPDMETAKKDLQRFLRKLKSVYKKQGIDFKWIATTEIGSKGGVHHHLIINRIPGIDIQVAKCWEKGRAHLTMLYEEGGFKELAEYIVKKTGKLDPQDKRYSRSRNLVQKEPVKQLMKRSTFEKTIKVPQGYYLDKESIIEGVNQITGYPYRHYMLIKLQKNQN